MKGEKRMKEPEETKELFFTEKDLKERLREIKEKIWDDLDMETQKALKKLLESALEVEIQDLVGAERWKHYTNRKHYRNGKYKRKLLTTYGWINDLKIPRIREGGVEFKTIEKYKRRTKDVDAMVLEMYLNGVSTRKIKEVLHVLLGDANISSSTVSEIAKQLDAQIAKYHNRPLKDDYCIIILDAVYVKAKDPLHSRNHCILVAYGIKEDGTREIIDFRLAHKGESQAAWESFIANLYYRGLEGKELKLVVMDGNKGAWNAIDLVWPNVKKQRCIAHKMRNVANYLPKSISQQCLTEAKEIYKAESYGEAVYNFKTWASKWENIVPKAVRCIEKDLPYMLTFYDFPKELWKKIRTTNIIERVFREVRRRTRPISCFTNIKSVERIIYAIFSRQNNIWKSQKLKITQKF